MNPQQKEQTHTQDELEDLVIASSLTIPAASFLPVGTSGPVDTLALWEIDQATGAIGGNRNSSGNYVVAPIVLTHGVRIRRFIVYCVSKTGSPLLELRFYKNRMLFPMREEFARIRATQHSDQVQLLATPEIDVEFDSRFSYWVASELHSSKHKILSVSLVTW
ncbi:hypothetical protein [Nannocystis pusilla]|uniref:hypothetical protein n=1 Tax=Nannocystis pusilla TaxID=889268 RepID=UPI003DA306BD